MFNNTMTNHDENAELAALAGSAIALIAAKETVINAISEKFGVGAQPEAQKVDPKDQARDALRGLFKR